MRALDDSDPQPTVSPAENLLARVRAGDADAWRELVARHAALVLAIPRKRGLPAEDCEEVFQATWIALHRQIDLIRSPAAVPAWIVTTARRQTWRLVRQRTARQQLGSDPLPLDLQGDELDPAQEAEKLERRHLVQRALLQLSERCRRLLDLLYLRATPLSYDQAAVELGTPRGSIGPTRIRCLARLATLVEGLRGGD